MKRIIHRSCAMAVLLLAAGQPSWADVVLSGSDTMDGSYSPAALSTETTPSDAVTIGGNTGISLWGALGGSASGVSVTNGDGSNTTTYGSIVTNTPAGDNSKNAILHYYVVATNIAGQTSAISLGELDPFFGGTGATPVYLQYGTTVGGVGSSLSLVVPNQPGRDLSNLTGLAVVGVPAVTGPGGQSSTLQLSGNTTASGTYNLAALQALPSTTVTAGATGSPSTTYTGAGLYGFLSPTSNNVDQIVIAQGSDGYEVVLALGELDPGDGGNPNDLLAWSATGNTQFPADGVARLVIPGDSHAGRWDSNLVSLTVETVPEPASFGLFAVALAGLAALRRRTRSV